MPWRRVALWCGTVAAAIALVVLGTMTALWFSVGGTFLRGEQLTVGTVLQMGLAVLACVGLVYLIRRLAHAARRT